MPFGNRGKDAGLALVKSIIVLILDFIVNIAWSIVALIIFGILSYRIYGTYFSGDEMLRQMAESPEFLFLSCVYNIFVIIMVYLFWKYIDRQGTDMIGLRRQRNSLSLFGFGILGGTIEIAIIILLSLLMGTLWFQGSGFEIYSIGELQRSLGYGLLAFILVGFGEEAVFRGYIQKRLMLSMGNKWALFISSLLFMLAHVFTYGKLLDFMDVALGGVILGYLYILTDSLYLPAAYHFIYDYLQVNIIRVQDYEYFKGGVLLIFNNSGDVLISGFNLGNVIEISFIIAELIILILLYMFRHQITSISEIPCKE